MPVDQWNLQDRLSLRFPRGVESTSVYAGWDFPWDQMVGEAPDQGHCLTEAASRGTEPTTPPDPAIQPHGAQMGSGQSVQKGRVEWECSTVSVLTSHSRGTSPPFCCSEPGPDHDGCSSILGHQPEPCSPRGHASIPASLPGEQLSASERGAASEKNCVAPLPWRSRRQPCPPATWVVLPMISLASTLFALLLVRWHRLLHRTRRSGATQTRAAAGSAAAT